MTLHNARDSLLIADDDILVEAGLPCLRRDGKLYYLTDVQPRVLAACRHFEIGFEQLAEKLGIARPALVLILKGYDPVAPALKGMLDRLVAQAGLLQAVESSPHTESAADSVPPIVTTILSVPVPEAPQAENARPEMAAATAGIAPLTVSVEEVVIPDVVSPDGVGAPHVVVPASAPDAAPGFENFTPGLRRRRRSGSGQKRGQFLLT